MQQHQQHLGLRQPSSSSNSSSHLRQHSRKLPLQQHWPRACLASRRSHSSSPQLPHPRRSRKLLHPTAPYPLLLQQLLPRLRTVLPQQRRRLRQLLLESQCCRRVRLVQMCWRAGAAWQQRSSTWAAACWCRCHAALQRCQCWRRLQGETCLLLCAGVLCLSPLKATGTAPQVDVCMLVCMHMLACMRVRVSVLMSGR